MIEKRIFSPRKRLSGFRDAKLIIIAAEGNKTEKKYFEDVAIHFHNPKIHIEVIEKVSTASAPEHVLRLLDDFSNKYKLRKNYDELWLVIDFDRWGERKLSKIAKLSSQKKYNMAVSNPCFELWLLLHLKSLDDYNENTLKEFIENKKIGNKTRLDIELTNLLGGYNKYNLDTTLFLNHVNEAIQEAMRLDIHPEHRWPNNLGTRVYILVEKVI